MSTSLVFTILLVLVALILWAVRCLARSVETPRINPEEAHALAFELASMLKRGFMIARVTPYSGGMGLRYTEKLFVYAPVNEGHISPPSEVAQESESSGRLHFATTEAFVDWLTPLLCSAPNKHYSDINEQRIRKAVETYRALADSELSQHVG